MAKIVLITRIFNHFLAVAFINIKKNNEPGGWKWAAEYPDKSEELKISENTEKSKWNLIKDAYGTKTVCLIIWASNYLSVL